MGGLDNSGRVFLRSQDKTYIKGTHCVLCCSGVESGELSCARTFSMHEKLQNIAMGDFELMARLESARDAIAGDVLYHSLCLRNRARVTVCSEESSISQASHNAIFNQLKLEIQWRTCRGQAVLVSECWSRFQDLCNEQSLVVPYYYESRRAFFKYKLTKLLPDITIIPRQGTELEDDLLISSSLSQVDVCEILNTGSIDEHALKLPAYNENEMVQMVHVALYLRNLILQHTPNKKAELTEENAYASVPEGLYVFMAIMYGGSEILDVDDGDDTREVEQKNADKLRKGILDICQDLTYGVSNGKIIPPKQYSLGLAAHQISGRNKRLVNLLHNAGQTISYKQCLQADTALSEISLKNIDPETGAVPPLNLVLGRPIQFGTDNIDCLKESAIAGHNAGYHGTQQVSFQPGPTHEQSISDIAFSKYTIDVPDVVHKVIELNKTVVKEPPFHLSESDVNSLFDMETMNSGNRSFREAKAKDLVFNVVRSAIDIHKKKTSNWTEFNKELHKSDKRPATIVGLMPLLNAKADDHDTINTCIERAKVIADKVGDDHVWFVADQAIYAPAQETIWTRGDSNVHFRLGGLHSSNIYMGTIGDHIADSELPQLWVEAGILTEGDVDKILHGRDYKAGLRTHKITWQAAWRILMPQFLEFLNKSHLDIYDDINTTSKAEDPVQPLLTRINTSEFFDVLEEFLAMKKQDKNFCFFWTYMDMVQVLLAFTRAQRLDDFKLHLNSFTRMVASFMRYDHQKYAKWGSIYIAEMKCLPSAVLTRFETDGYGVQWRDEASFTSVDVDHATEWVNAAAKTSGGLSTITQIDSATLKWMLSFHARSTITTNACDYYNVSQNENDLTPSELKLEARYEDKLVEQMLKYNLFEGRNPDKLTTIINKDVAPPQIEESLLESESKGQEEVKRFMKESVISSRSVVKRAPSISANSPHLARRERKGEEEEKKTSRDNEEMRRTWQLMMLCEVENTDILAKRERIHEDGTVEDE
ncbi:uncharacterized protein [Palaemon carinicauda]|uniref:uncharacterized protein n=1 Tax=Palaemon carinicauda TaxID=392227 RepID=UPI0035B57F61